MGYGGVIVKISSHHEGRSVHAEDVRNLDHVVPRRDKGNERVRGGITVRQNVFADLDVARLHGFRNGRVLRVVQGFTVDFFDRDGVAGVGVVYHAEGKVRSAEGEIVGEVGLRGRFLRFGFGLFLGTRRLRIVRRGCRRIRVFLAFAARCEKRQQQKSGKDQ